MSDPLVSDSTFRWIITAFTMAGCLWALYDVVHLVQLRGANMRDPLVRDRRFGYWIGIVIGVLAFAGVLRFHGVF
ncbi:MAG: hypothetical protein ABI867_37340 [Kofleriaceae bacterium]